MSRAKAGSRTRAGHPGPVKARKPAQHKKGSKGSYTPKRKSKIRALRAPEPNFHGAYCEYMPSSRSVFVHGPMSALGPQYIEASSPQELWDAIGELSEEPGALDRAARMPRGTEALDWNDGVMRGLIRKYAMEKEINQCPQGPGLPRPVKVQRKLSLEELGLA